MEVSENAERRVGIEVTYSTLTAVCLKNDGTVEKVFSTETDPDVLITSQLNSFIETIKQEFGQFESVGIAIPGLIDASTRRVEYSAQIPAHAKVDIVNEIEGRSGVKVFIENDANAAALGEYSLGAGRGSKDMFYITLGVGVGGALIFDNKLWHGNSGFAGEFGYFAINSEGMKLEDLASSESILQRTKDRFHQDPTSSLNKTGEDNITIEDVVREAQNEDDFAQLMLQRTGSYVGTAVASVINLLNIEKIVVGGQIMEAEDLVLDAIKTRAKELSFAPSFKTVEILKGELGRNAAAVGAALLSRRAGE
ncbi:MAG: ROK family protein [Acidobacteria bacterium]|nr:ROK family protein [Acidobacteriota bacterium]